MPTFVDVQVEQILVAPQNDTVGETKVIGVLTLVLMTVKVPLVQNV